MEGESVSKPIEETTPGLGDKIARLINWNVDMSLRLLRQIAARRRTQLSVTSTKPTFKDRKETPIDEVAEIISLPTFDAKTAEREINPEKIELGSEVEDELRDFVTTSKCAKSVKQCVAHKDASVQRTHFVSLNLFLTVAMLCELSPYGAKVVGGSSSILVLPNPSHLFCRPRIESLS